MAIDEPLEALEAVFAAEERASAPLARYTGPMAKILGIIPGLNAAVTTVAKATSMFLERESKDRFELLLAVLVDEMKRVNAKLGDLGKDREEFQQEFPNLVLDWLRKAEQTRAKERVERLGHILGHAYQQGPRKPLDLAEELMRVAMSLNEQDSVVLAWLCNGLREHFSADAGQVDDWNTNKFWGQIDDHGYTRSHGMPPVPAGMNVGDVMACCAKLQGFGLVIQVRQNSSNVRKLPYSPLGRAYEFLDYVQGAAAS